MSKCEKEVKIKIEGKEWKESIDKALEKVTKNINLDGFRKGHAPKDMVIKKYGQANIWLDAADLCINEAYKKMIDGNKDIEIVAQPTVAISAMDDDYVEYTFTLTTKPEVKLNKYKKLGVKKDSVEVTDKEVEDSLNHMREHYAESVTKDGAIADGDTAIIDFEGFKDGVAFEGGKGENYSLKIGSNTFIPGFEEQLIGMKKGEEKDIIVTFPEDYHAEDLKGAKATFKVKVNEVKETKIPELDKDFFEDLAMEGINDEASLKKELKENLKVQKETQAENKFMEELINKALENMEVEVPHVMIHEEMDRMLKQYEENLKMQGLTLEQFYQFTNSDANALKDQMHPEAEKRVKERFLLEEIIKLEKIEVSLEEAEKEATELAKKYQMEKDEFLKLFGGIEMVQYDMQMRKALDIMKENN